MKREEKGKAKGEVRPWQRALWAAALVALLVPAGRALALAPDQPGPFKVGHYSTAYFNLYGLYWATIYYPARWNGWLAPKDTAESPYPGVVFAPGFASTKGDYDWVPNHLVTHGYVVLSFTPPNPVLIDVTQWAAGIRSGIDKLVAENRGYFSPIRHLVDESRFGAMGVSMGGAGALEAAGKDGRIAAVVPLAPGNSELGSFIFEEAREWAARITAPTQIQIGSHDCIVGPQGALEYYGLLSLPTREYVEIAGANHVNYLDAGSFGEVAGEIVDCDAAIPVEEQHRVARKYFTAWYELFLKGTAAYYPFVFGNEARADLSAGVLSSLAFDVR